MSEPRLDPGRNASDFLLIVAILALCLFAVHHNFAKKDTASPAEDLRAPGTQGMDMLWRDSVKAQGRKDMRPQADPKVVWEEPGPAWQDVSAVDQAAEPKTEVHHPDNDEDFAVPPLPEQRETALPRPNMPKLEPMRESFMNNNRESASSSAFLQAPPLAPQEQAREGDRQQGQRAGAPDSASGRKGASSTSNRTFRRLDARP